MHGYDLQNCCKFYGVYLFSFYKRVLNFLKLFTILNSHYSS